MIADGCRVLVKAQIWEFDLHSVGLRQLAVRASKECETNKQLEVLA